MTFFDQFRRSIDFQTLHDGIIGAGATIDGPFGTKPLIYADYVASGRALRQVETAIMDHVLPWYANSHTEASHCGGVMTRLRREARAEILRCMKGGPEHAVVFAGSGATAGINRLAHLLGAGPDSTVLLGPYEHHSNILPWRESGARVVTLPEDTQGGPDRTALTQELARGGQIIAAFSAASNVNGTLTDIAAITAQVKAAGAKIIWDYAGGAPYLPINLRFGMDAITASPHKFIGGPGASGVLVVRRDAVTTTRPTLPGGGTVRFVNHDSHDYADAIEQREEGGTPNVIGDIRAAMVFALKDQIGQKHIDRVQLRWHAKAEKLHDLPGLQLLWNHDLPRLPILAFRVRDGNGGFIHQQLVTRMLSDLYGIQARGGCACAGPYVHQLLGIGSVESEAMRRAILRGDEIEKPGFVRLNLCWAAPEPEIDAILDAIAELPTVADSQQTNYSCDKSRAIFSPAA